MRPALTFTAAAATLLGSVALHSLFAGGKWFGAVIGVVLAVAGMGLLARRLRLPAAVALPAGLFAVHLFLTAAFTSSAAFLWVLPTPSSMTELGRLMREGWAAAGEYAAPVPLGPGIIVLVTLGVGLVAAVVDFLAVRMRRVAAAGLPLLAMYSVPAAVREDSVSWPAFALGATGFLALLLVDSRDRLSGWGRPISGRSRADYSRTATPGGWADDVGRHTRGLTSTGRRIGITAVVIAVLLPTAVPGLHPRGLFGMGGVSGAGGGSQTVTTPDPLVSLKRELTRQDDAVVLTYRTDDPSPDYLRLYALDRFDGDHWTYSRLQSTVKDRIKGRRLPPAPGLERSRTRLVTTRVAVDRRVEGMSFLPVPYAPTEVAIKGDWRVDASSLMVFSLKDSAAGKGYTVRSRRLETDAEVLRTVSAVSPPEDITTQFLYVPRQVPDQVRQRAESITQGARSPFDRAMKLQQWFTAPGRYIYDLSAQPPRHTSDLIDFLEHSRRGYCEQFAATMAVLARTLGIPARVAMGYTAGTQDASGLWTVRAKDAHAWPELYFSGVGWVRFEPTPGGAQGQGTSSTPAYAVPPSTTETGRDRRTTPRGEASPAVSPTSAPGPAAQGRKDDPQAGKPLEDPAEDEDGVPVALWFLLAALLAVILAMPTLVRVLARRSRWAAAAAARAARGGAGGGTGPGAGPGGGAEPGSAEPARAGAPAGGTAGTLTATAADETVVSQAVHTAWLELRSDVIDHGLSWRVNESPRATGRRLTAELGLSGPAAEALNRIVKAEERARYAPDGAASAVLSTAEASASAGPVRSAGPVAVLRADSLAVRKAMAGAVDRRTRWRARLLPPSAVADLRDHARRTVRRADEVITTRGRELSELTRRVLPDRLRGRDGLR